MLALDLPGHGQSTWISKGQLYYFNETVTWIRHVVKYFGWDKMSLMGHSIGSAFVYSYAAMYPDEVDKLVSIDCTRSLVMTRKDNVDQLAFVVDKLLKIENKMESSEPPSYLFSDMVELMYSGYGGSLTRDSCGALLMRGVKRASSPHMYHFSRDPRLKVGYHGCHNEKLVLDIAAEIKCDFLSIRGKSGVEMDNVSEEVYKETLKLLQLNCRRFEHHEVEGTHHLHLNTPEVVAPIINKFLES